MFTHLDRLVHIPLLIRISGLGQKGPSLHFFLAMMKCPLSLSPPPPNSCFLTVHLSSSKLSVYYPSVTSFSTRKCACFQCDHTTATPIFSTQYIVMIFSLLMCQSWVVYSRLIFAGFFFYFSSLYRRLML